MDSDLIVLLRVKIKLFWVCRHYSHWHLVAIHLFVDLILKNLLLFSSRPLIFFFTYLLLIIVILLRRDQFCMLMGILVTVNENLLFEESLSFLLFLLLFLLFKYLTTILLSLLYLVQIILNMHFLHFLFELSPILDRHLS